MLSLTNALSAQPTSGGRLFTVLPSLFSFLGATLPLQFAFLLGKGLPRRGRHGAHVKWPRRSGDFQAAVVAFVKWDPNRTLRSLVFAPRRGLARQVMGPGPLDFRVRLPLNLPRKVKGNLSRLKTLGRQGLGHVALSLTVRVRDSMLRFEMFGLSSTLHVGFFNLKDFESAGAPPPDLPGAVGATRVGRKDGEIKRELRRTKGGRTESCACGVQGPKQNRHLQQEPKKGTPQVPQTSAVPEAQIDESQTAKSQAAGAEVPANEFQDCQRSPRRKAPSTDSSSRQRDLGILRISLLLNGQGGTTKTAQDRGIVL